MFITKGTRHDKADILEFLNVEGPWQHVNVDRGAAFIAREGSVVAHARLIEVAPQKLIVEEVLVRKDKRGQGLGAQIVQAAMNNRGGKLYLCCHDEHIAFYEKLGFSLVEFDDLPPEVQQYHRDEEDYPTEEGHEHFFMTAR